MSVHPSRTLFADRVVFYKNNAPHVAFVTHVNSDHNANLVYYCPVSHAWQEATSITFGKRDDSDYFINPEA